MKISVHTYIEDRELEDDYEDIEDMDDWLKQIDEVAAEMRTDGRPEEEVKEYIHNALHN